MGIKSGLEYIESLKKLKPECAGGTPETNRVEVWRNYDLFEKIKNVKALCNIKEGK